MNSSARVNSSFKTIFARLYLVLALIVIPALASNEGLKYFAAGNRDIEIKSSATKLSEISSGLSFHANSHEFWLNQLSSKIAKTDSPEALFAELTNFFKELKFGADVIVYDGQGNFVADNFTSPLNQAEAWKNAGKHLKNIVGHPNSQARFSEIDKLRKLFGRNFFSHVSAQFEEFSVSPVLYATDFSNDKYRFWFGKKKTLLVVVRFQTDDLKKKTGLKYFLKEKLYPDLQLAFFQRDLLRNTEFSPIQAKEVFYHLQENPKEDYVCKNDHIFAKVRVDPSTQVLMRLPLKGKEIRAGKITIIVTCVLIFFLIMALKNGWLPPKIENFSVLIQIIVLVIVSTGVPLMILGIIGSNYFNNKKTALIKQKNNAMISFIKQIEQNYDCEFAIINRHLNKTIAKHRRTLQGSQRKGQNRKLGEELFKYAGSVEFRRGNQRIGIASPFQLKNAYTERYKIKGNHPKNPKEKDKVPEDAKSISIISKYHLATLNNKSPTGVGPEDEMIVEWFFQKPIWMAVHELVKIEGTVTETSWGSQKILAFIKALKLLKQNVFDSYLVIAAGDDPTARIFHNRVLPRIFRNSFGYKVFVTGAGDLLLNTGKSILQSPKIGELLKHVTRFPFAEPVIVDFEEKPHIFVGLHSSRMNYYRYCVLFPLETIQNAIDREAKDLLMIAGLAFILVFFMILTLYLNLLLPVNRLHQAANALINRDSSFRLPSGGNDEFAEMAEIFNASIAEFEELQLAGIVQQRLLPNKPLQIEGFSIFGKSIPMAFMGGDYFDSFSIDDERFVVLLGDVAGHGVGAALIMAMAKAGVICADEFADDPAQVLARLHQIILALKNKMQRKVMTFQYLQVDRRNNRMIYANAGACSPVIIDSKDRTMKVINQTSAVLGGFKKSKFTNLELSIEPGQAIVFYTDGMVESRNEEGQELGYDGLYEIFLESYDENAEKYYENISQTYKNWLGGMEAGDDLTIVIAVCNNCIQASDQFQA